MVEKRYIDLQKIQIWSWHEAEKRFVFSGDIQRARLSYNIADPRKRGAFIGVDQIKYAVERNMSMDTDTHFGYVPCKKGHLPIAFLLPKELIDPFLQRIAIDLATLAINR